MKMLFNGFGNPPVPDTKKGRAIIKESIRLGDIEIKKDLMRIAKIKSRMYGGEVLEHYKKEAQHLDELEIVIHRVAL